MLVATDAAGEGINLQRAHLMVNYDLPWNPNRIEQRFGRIHRIGQTEVCHMWNLVVVETREGEVYKTLLEKLEKQGQALGGQVFDVLRRVRTTSIPKASASNSLGSRTGWRRCVYRWLLVARIHPLMICTRGFSDLH